MPDARGNVDLVGHLFTSVTDARFVDVDNVILRSDDSNLRWATEAMTSVGEWRARLRSVYIQWALAINGLFLASERFRSADYDDRPSQFTVSSIRVDSGEPLPKVIARWDWPTAAANHTATVRKMAVFGLIDLYSNPEDCVFSFALIYYRQHPDHLLRGAEFRELRRLRRDAETDGNSERDWLTALDARLESWRRKRLYDGLEKIMVTFFEHAGLEKPKDTLRGQSNGRAISGCSR